MSTRSPPGSPRKGRFKWLRRLFRRLKYRHCKFKDGKHVKGRADVDQWQEDHPIAGADFPDHRWQRFSGLSPALPSDMTSSTMTSEGQKTRSPRRHSSPPGPIIATVPPCGKGRTNYRGAVPHSPVVVIRGRSTEQGGHSPATQSEPEAVTSCLPTKRREKKKSNSPARYEVTSRRSVDICTQTDTATTPRDATEAAYVAFLRQEFANKYRYLTQGGPPIADSPEVAPKLVLSLDDCLQSPPKSILHPELASTRRHTIELGTPSPRTQPRFLTPPQTPLKTETDHHNRTVHFNSNADNHSDIVTDFENVRNQFNAEEMTKRRKRLRKQRRRQRIRNQIYRKLMSPKGYKPLKEDAEDKPEIMRLEVEFEERKQGNLRRKWPSQEKKDMVRRVSDGARESVQQVVSGISRLHLELPQVSSGSYQPFQRQAGFEPLHETPYIHQGIMVN